MHGVTPATGNTHSVRRSIQYLAAGSAFAVLSATSAFGQAEKPSASCESLAKLTLPNATITNTQSYSIGEFKVPTPAGRQGPGGGPRPGGPGGPGEHETVAPAAILPAFCRVSLTLKPSSDSDIKMEAWLPTSGWNGKFVGVANFGTAGSLLYDNMVAPLQAGYALAANDTGHQGGGGDFAIGHPEKMIDYGYRADHEMTVKAKQIVTEFYGKAASRSIWIGCSLGGIEALIEAKRYPDDYDGIIAGAPPNPITLFNSEQIWEAWLNFNHPEGAIPREKFAMVHQAVLHACASPVGLAQGFIEDPEHCEFKPETLLCKSGDSPECLTAPQVARLRQLYEGPRDPRTNKIIFPGPNVGAEGEFEPGSTSPVFPAIALYRDFVYQDPKWDWKTLDYATSVDKASKTLDPLLRVDPQDLSAFLQHGKLMLYVGWTEGHNGNDLANFYKAAVKDAGPGKANNVRLFLVPGMNHCGGGTGCDTFEKVGVVDQWLQTEKAPEEILSSKLQAGKTIRTRPLCAYPEVAKYNGAGSMDEAASFTCARPQSLDGSTPAGAP